MKSALILVDIQNEYFEGGNIPLHQPEEAAAQAKRLITHFRDSSLPVFHVRHINSRPGAVTFLPDSIGSEIHMSVAPQGGETVIIKHFPSAFLQTGLAAELQRQDVDHIVICGMMSHMCIDTTVRAAQDHSFSVTLPEDACTTRALVWNGQVIPAETVHHTFMAALSGMFAQVVTTDDYLASEASVS